jgi:hypothetical protein
MVDGLVCLLLTVPCILGLSAHLPDGAAHDAKVRNAVARTHSHEAISPWTRGSRRDWEGAQQLLNQLAAFAQVLNIFLQPLVLFIEYTCTKPTVLYLERRLQFPLFCVHLLSWAAAHIAPVKLSRGSSSFYNYWSWGRSRGLQRDFVYLCDQKRPRMWAQMRGRAGGTWVV